MRNSAPHIDTNINPEIEVVKTIHRFLRVPGAVDVGEFADGRVKFVGLKLAHRCKLIAITLEKLREHTGDIRPLIAAIVRRDQLIIPRCDDQLEPDDLVYIISEEEKLIDTLTVFGKQA